HPKTPHTKKPPPPPRADTDPIGNEEPLAVTDPRRNHHDDRDPDSHCSAESVDCHSVGDYQPVTDCKPVALLIRRGRVRRNKQSFLVLVGAGGLVACSRGSDAPSRGGSPSTRLEGLFCKGRARCGVVCPRARP